MDGVQTSISQWPGLSRGNIPKVQPFQSVPVLSTCPVESLKHNPRLICTFHALQMSLFPMAIISVFYTRDIGMSMQEIMWLQGGFGLAMVLAEFPTGYLSDRIGYRRSLIIACFTQILGWGIYATASSFVQIIIAELVLGAGLSLVSGTDAALLYESLKETGQEEGYTKWSGRMKFWGQCGEGTAAVVAGALYAWWGRSPFIIEMMVWVAAFFVALRFVEPARHRPPLQDNWRQIKAMFHKVLRGSPPLRATFFTIIAFGMASFIPVWTIQIYAQEGGLPTAWLGPMWAVANYSVALGALASHALVTRWGSQRLLIVCALLGVGGYLGLGLSHALLGFAFYYALTLMRGLFNPVLLHSEQRLIPSSDRAGFRSLRSLFFRAIFLVIAPLIGLAIDTRGQRPVMLGLALIFALIFAAGLGALRRNRVIQ